MPASSAGVPDHATPCCANQWETFSSTAASAGSAVEIALAALSDAIVMVRLENSSITSDPSLE
jgi:hypothetical protein